MVYINADSTNPALDLYLLRLASQYSLVRTYRAGETLFTEGQPGSTMLLVLRGALGIIKRVVDSDQLRVIATRGPGDFLGEMAIVEESPRFATVIAQTDCEVLEFSRANFERAIQEQPALATRVLRSLSRKLRESDSTRIAELEDSNRALAASNDELTSLNYFLDRLIEDSPSAVLVVLQDGRIFRLNRAATRLFEIDSDAAGLAIRDFLPDIRLEMSESSDGHAKQIELTGVRSGNSFPALASVSVIKGPESNGLFLIMCQDISELQELNETIVAVEKHGATTDVVAEVAHDVKNYLAIITGHIELLVSRLDEEQKERLSRSIKAIESTTGEVALFLDGAMLLDRRTAPPSDVNLVNIIRTLIRFCRSQSRFSQIEFEIEVDPNFPKAVRTVGDLVRRIILNLVLNSAEALNGMEFQAEKSISIYMLWDEPEQRVVIRVEDNGPGIPEEYLARVFRERFTTKKRGHGIGLVSVAHMVESQGGTIAVKSERNRGTMFEVTLPVQTGSANA